MISSCPFCNSSAVQVLENSDSCWVNCMDCNADGPVTENIDQAILEWNRAGVTNGQDAA